MRTRHREQSGFHSPFAWECSFITLQLSCQFKLRSHWSQLLSQSRNCRVQIVFDFCFAIIANCRRALMPQNLSSFSLAVVKSLYYGFREHNENIDINYVKSLKIDHTIIDWSRIDALNWHQFIFVSQNGFDRCFRSTKPKEQSILSECVRVV